MRVEEVVTRCCSFRLDPGGFVHATIREGATFEVTDARDAVAATWQIAGEQRRPVLVDMRGVRTLPREARDYFLSDEAATKLRAVALVASSPVAKVIGNFILRLGDHKVPTQIFTEQEAARAWLGEHVA